MRLFIAIDTNSDIREGCRGIMSSLRDTGADIKTVSEENLHVTLKFLGEVREDYVKKIESVLQDAASSHGPFSMGFSVLGYFGGTRFPRTIWVGVSEGRDSVIRMMNELNEKLEWVKKEDKKPRPHLTLARVRTPRNSERLVEAIQEMRDVKLGEVDVKELLLMRSVLKPEGPEYSVLRRFPLSGKT